MNGATVSETETGDGERIKEELLKVLERARGRLAIAIAGESKSTTANRRKQYLETADHMRRYIRTLRDGDGFITASREGWIPALEALHHMPQGKGAQFLCDRLRDIVAGLGGEDI